MISDILDRPLVVFDLETTGTNTQEDRIVQFAALKIQKSGQYWYEKLINPEKHIPEQATKVHGITNEEVKNAPTFDDVSGEVSDFLQGCHLAGFNVFSFDIPLLLAEFSRSGSSFEVRHQVIDAMVIFMLNERRTLEAALKFYCEKDHTDAHDARGDVTATLDVLQAQLTRYDLPNTIEELGQLCRGNRATLDGKLQYDDDGELVFNFGKHRGSRVRDVGLNYVRWVLQADFSDELKKVLREAI